MPKFLFIAEKPSLCRDYRDAFNSIKNTLPYDADFVQLHGHFMELCEPNEYCEEWAGNWNEKVLPMIPDKFKFKVKKDCKSDFNTIKDKIKNGKYDAVVNACDAGREGQAIFWTLYSQMGFSIPAKRAWASDTTLKTLSEALRNLLDEETGVIPETKGNTLKDMKLASLNRMYFDWLVGMNLTRAISLKMNKTISVGRVMTPTLAIVVNRDLEILNFKPKDSYEVVCDFEKYKGSWFNPTTNESVFTDKVKADKFKDSLKGKKGKIESIITEKVSLNAPALHSLAELQKEASKVYGFTASQTLDLAQKLYEDYKILSYPRTEATVLSTNLSKEISKRLKPLLNVDEVKDYVSDILKDDKIIKSAMSSKKYVNDKKIADHHAIIPTETVPNFLIMKPNEIKLYLLVAKRFVSIFLKPYITNKTTIITDVENEKFKTVGSVLVDLGFKKIYGTTKVDSIIPAVSKGEEHSIKNCTVNTKTSVPPNHFSDGDLINAMTTAGKFLDDTDNDSYKDILKETEGIGTSATRAGIIEKLIAKNMLERKGKLILATNFGINIIKVLDGKNIISPSMTAEWEGKLRDIEGGTLKPIEFNSQMLTYVKDETSNFLNLKGSFSHDDKFEVVGKCPKCGAPVVKTKLYYKCQNYKSETIPCDFIFKIKFLETTIPTSEFSKVLNGKESKKFKFIKPKDGTEFTASLCLTNGEIKFAKNNTSSSSGDNKPIGKCPKCGKAVLDKGVFCKCEACDFSLGYKIKGIALSKSDIKNLLNDKETAPKDFDFGPRKLKYNKQKNKLDFLK